MDGQALKEDGQAAVLAAATVPHHDHPLIVGNMIDNLAETYPTFTAEDVRAALPAPTAEWLEQNGSVLSALIAARARTMRIRAVGWVPTTRAKRRCGPIRVWTAA